MVRRANFDFVAQIYSSLEGLMFGRALDRVRFDMLEHLRDSRHILLLGDGDGRCLARLVKIAPEARFHSVDFSPAMLARAAARLSEAERARVDFICADVREWTPAPASYDAVVTLFFFDILSVEDVQSLVTRLQPALRHGARWLWADFVLPARGLARWRAQIWLWAMYAFFRWTTGLTVRALPPAEEILRAALWQPVATREYQGIFVRSVLFSQPGCVS